MGRLRAAWARKQPDGRQGRGGGWRGWAVREKEGACGVGGRSGAAHQHARGQLPRDCCNALAQDCIGELVELRNLDSEGARFHG